MFIFSTPGLLFLLFQEHKGYLFFVTKKTLKLLNLIII